MTDKILISLKETYFRYQTSAIYRVLEAFSFQLDIEDRMALYGPNGCGKSTLLYVLAGFLFPEEGERIVEKNFQSGFVFQDYSRSLLNWYTVAENLQLALRVSKPGVYYIDALHEAIGTKFPKWLDIALDKYPYELSGGQRQLVCLLRAFIGLPKVLFLDEPFSSLDVIHKRMAVDLLSRAKERGSATWIIIAHDLDDCFLAADRVLVMNGPPLDIVSQVQVPLGWPRSCHSHKEPSVYEARGRVYEALWNINENI